MAREAKPGGASSPVAYKAGDRLGVVQFTREAAVGLDLSDGKQLWRYPWCVDVYSTITPVIHGDTVYLAGTGAGGGGVVIRLTPDQPKVLWKSKDAMTNCFQTSVLVDGYLYGTHAPNHDSGRATLRCVSFDTGEVKWDQQEKGFGHASLISADGKLIVLGQQGQLMVVEASPKSFKKLVSAKVVDHTGYECQVYACPVLSGGKIYCRNGGGDLVCLDLRKP